MKTRLQFYILSIFFLANTCLLSQSISVTDNFTAQDLVQNKLVNSSCATVSNFSVTGGNFGVQDSYGYFTDGGSTFPFQNGVILSTGKAVSAVGPNASLLSEGSTSWTGDSDLEQALNISNSINATILEFDFTPLTNKFSFDYIFSSEQYLSNPSANQCNFTDGFAFLLKPVFGGSTYQNIAVIPGTTTPVKVNTVRGSGTICPAINEQFFDAFNGTNHPTNFNGQTKVLKAEATVIPGTLYHIKLVIADQGNNLYDSAIFLKGGSFKSATDITTSKNAPFCSGENITLTANQSGTNSYKWFKNGIEIIGETNPTYTITDNTNLNEIIYTVQVTLGSTTCTSDGEIKIKFNPLPLLSNQTLIQCDDNIDGFSIFNLTKLDNAIRNNDLTLGNVNYYESLGGIAIANPSTYQNTSPNSQTIYAKVSNTAGCSSNAIVTLQISNNSIPPQNDIEICDEDGTFDGKANFILPTQLIGVPNTLIIEYYLNLNDAVKQTNPLTSPYRNAIPNTQTIYARAINGSDCYGISPINLVVNTFNPPNFQDELKTLCDGNSIYLSVANNFASYNWIGNNDFDNEIEVTSAGEYIVEVTDANICKARKKFIVKSSAAATNIDAMTEDFSSPNNSITITFTDNGGDYLFSIDGINYQENPLFNNVLAGEYTIYVKDKNGCLPIASKTIYILDFPKFFTPNGDGFNDTWSIENSQTKPNTIIYIYDRFGKLLKQLNSNSLGWNGTFNGENLPSGDYWFTLTLFNNKTIKSHFSLKR
ncbi:choice-of-anchor L domain-containing protein [Flavobacterium sp.]|uniref:choice-of-anchor L domain-containing protein n=1 Tax=Flavobacterium sp. TaxID=239 RepID=UPI00286C3BA9|nr:choice-of-anchor L domain-containing protein [Flavobacterium sp.]